MMRAAEDIQVPVNFISNSVAGTTGTIELRATWPNADGTLVPGQLVDVTVNLAQIPHATAGAARGPETPAPTASSSMPSRTAPPSRCRSRC